MLELEKSLVPVPEWWTSRENQIQEFLRTKVTSGQVTELCRSSGGRTVRMVSYGESEEYLRGTANLSSALGARNPDLYFKRKERKRPVLVIMAGVHGHEVEGMVGVLSLINIMETGQDLRGSRQSELRSLLGRLNLVVFPLMNPDGRARVPYDGLCGLSWETMRFVGQGTHADGSLWGYPDCKASHPMKEDVGFLGGYFDDAGINLQHDFFFAPMAPPTQPLLDWVHQYAPDFMFNLHSHEHSPAILEPRYLPLRVKKDIRQFAEAFKKSLETAGLVSGSLPKVQADGESEIPPSFNLTSALYHAGAAIAVTHESPHGLADEAHPFSYDQILDIHHILFQTAAEKLLHNQNREAIYDILVG